MFARTLMLALLAALSAAVAPPIEVFDLKVTRVRTLRDQPGDLHIDAEGATFRSTDGKTTIAIPMKDLREVSVADAHALRFGTYEVQKWKPVERVEYTFRAQPDAPVEDLAQFLTPRVYRTVVGHYPEESQFQAAAYHRRARAGTAGLLKIGPESIQFVSDKPADSRTWLYSDIETIGRPDSFRFRVTTNRETYVLELKEALPESAYDLAWSKVYNLKERQMNH
ncbi:MAG: hypothetical protein ABI833_23400 [Acidobacteriota bacterium]